MHREERKSSTRAKVQRDRKLIIIITHLPEVLLHAKGQHTLRGQILEPQLTRLLVGLDALLALKVGDVHTVRIEAENVHEQFPRPSDALSLEVVTE